MTDFVPPEFEPPLAFEAGAYRLEPLGPQHNERDHAAWMGSIDHIRSTPGFDGPDADWPVAMPLEQNLEDLEMHARHFVERSGFTYSILDGDEVVGCLYIYPSPDPAHDARVASWVVSGRAGDEPELRRAIVEWLASSWPFSNPAYFTPV